MKAKKLRLTTSAKILIAAIILVAVVLTQFVLFPLLGAGRDMVIVGTGRGLTYDFDSGAAFHSNDSRFFYFMTRDSLRFIQASNENLIWHHPFVFNNPWLSARGDFVAVGEATGGRTIYVFDDSGLLFPVNMSNTIQSFWINETGFLSVIVSYDGGHGVYVFNQARNTEENPFFRWTTFDDLFTPTHAEVSPDGRYIVIVTVDLNINVRTSVQFRYTSQWDAWGTEQGHFATQDFPGDMVTALSFMDGNRLIIATTSQIAGFQLGPRHMDKRELWPPIPLENQKTAIEFYGGTHFAFASGARRRMTLDEGDPMGLVRIYHINGQLTGTFEMGRRVTHLRMGHNALIVGGDRSFHAVDFRGNPIWEYTSLFDTRYVLFLDNTNTILVAGATHAEIFERRRRRGDEGMLEGDL